MRALSQRHWSENRIDPHVERTRVDVSEPASRRQKGETMTEELRQKHNEMSFLPFPHRVLGVNRLKEGQTKVRIIRKPWLTERV
jgi:hypothetical protein